MTIISIIIGFIILLDVLTFLVKATGKLARSNHQSFQSKYKYSVKTYQDYVQIQQIQW